MHKNKIFRLLAMTGLIGSLLVMFSACQQVSAADVKGLLQAVEGKEIVVKLDDGTVVRITVNDAQAAAEAQKLVGKQVDAKVKDDKGAKQLEKVEKRAKVEDQKASGSIESITATSARIGGKDFKITATTELNGLLETGVNAKIEFITLPDGTLMATSIESEKEVKKLQGKIDSLKDNGVVIDGQSFHIDDRTQRDQGLKEGETVHVEVADDKGVNHVVEIEHEVEDSTATGAITSINANSVVIGGKTFKINSATMLDSGLVAGAPARVEFITMADGTLVATKVEADQPVKQVAPQQPAQQEPAGDRQRGK